MDVPPFDRRSFLRRPAVTAGGSAIASVATGPSGASAPTGGVPSVVFDRPSISHGVM
jgi:hypothetical protein